MLHALNYLCVCVRVCTCVCLPVRMYVCLGVRVCARADLSIPYWVDNREELLWCVGSIGGKGGDDQTCKCGGLDEIGSGSGGIKVLRSPSRLIGTFR